MSEMKKSQVLVVWEVPTTRWARMLVDERPKDKTPPHIYAMQGKRVLPIQMSAKDKLVLVENAGKPFNLHVVYRGDHHMFPFIERK